VAHRRYAILAVLCALGACAYLPVAAALGARRARVGSFHHGHRHHHHHGGRCTSRPGRRHAKRSSFRTGARPRHAGGRCPRRRHHRHAHRRHHGAPQRLGHAPAAKSSACLDADLTPTAYDVPRVRAATLCLVNRERAGHGESPLSEDPRVTSAAQSHTEDMAFGDYFDHVGRHGDTPLSRLRASGYLSTPRAGYEIGENIAWGTLWLATPRAIVAAWMASPGHRANILDSQYRDTGIGVSPHPLASFANGQPGAIYTQDFGVTFG
jgi:uncharacterized protein YkwD